MTFAGQVLDPEEKPRAGASVYLDLSFSSAWLHKLGTTGADGRFHATVSRRDFTNSKNDDLWRFAKIMAISSGFGPAWVRTPVSEGRAGRSHEDLALRLNPDDVPIEGRIVYALDTPVAAARVIASRLSDHQTADGGEIPWDRRDSGSGLDVRLGNLVPAATTNSDGRFSHDGDRPRSAGFPRLVGREVGEQEIQVRH